MASKAKIMAPGLHGIVPRPRLFKKLGRKKGAPITWITGPPGAGKTALAASYVRQGATGHLWYQADSSDGDPAILFAYLEQAIKKVSRRRQPTLPAFGSEYGQGMLIYARRFFEALFARLPAGGLLVLDNYQEIPAQALTHEVLSEGLSVLPPGIHVLVLSRQPPPADFARLQAEGQMALLAWEELRMTQTEAASLLRTREPGGAADRASAFYQLVDGWPAGLVLLALGSGKSAPALPLPEEADRKLLFDYFASEVFDRLEPELRDVLLRTALLPQCSATQAQAMTGSPEAGNRLRSMAKTGCFTVEHGRSDPAYEFHPLFREFLLHRGAAQFPAETWTSLQLQAATCLEAAGQLSEAFELYRNLGALEHQIALIKAQAPMMLMLGQTRTLHGWFESLDLETVAGNSWLLLWLGVCQMPLALAQSRAHVEQAFTRFGAEGESTGQFLAWAAAVASWLYAWDDYSRLDPWILWLDAHLDLFERLQAPAIKEMVTVSMVWALVHRQPDHPAIATWVQRAEQIFREGSTPQIRLRAGTAAVIHHLWAGERVACGILANATHRMAATLREPMAVLTSHWTETAVHSGSCLLHARCREAVEAGLALGAHFGIHFFDFMFHGQAAMMAIEGGDLATARGILGTLEQVAQGHNSWSFYHYMASWVAYLEGDLASATAHAEASVAKALLSGMPSSEVISRLALVDLVFENGRWEDVAVQTELAHVLVQRLHSPQIDMIFHLGAARRGLSAADPGPALEHLRQGFALGRAHDLVHFYWRVPAWMSQLCLAALEHGIETEFARHLIQLHKLRPVNPPTHCPDWPWELRITTLGRFSITRNGQELAFSAKAPRKLLLLLKALIAAGHRGIGERKLIRWLWPEADGDMAQHALETGIYRLRQRLDVDGVILLREGHVTLDPFRCWVDAHAFESLLEPLLAAPSAPVEEPEERSLQQALALYAGPFLENLEEPWAESYRKRLRGRCVQAVLAQGARCEEARHAGAAIAWYERGLEADPLAEVLYQRIMLCHQVAGRRAEVLRVQERCRFALRTALGVNPSPETEAVAQTLH